MSRRRGALGRVTRPATTGLLLLGAALLCGLRLPAAGDRTLAFEGFGFVEGVLALLVLFLFLRQGVLPASAIALERVLLFYWLCATAVLLRLALPPPGLGYWIGAVIVSAVLLGAFGGGDRRRSLFTLGIAVAACGVLRFGVIPFVWRNASLPDLGPIELGGVSDWAKGLVTDYQPVRAGNEVLNVIGIGLYALAIWREWPVAGPDPLAGMSADERDRLLRMLVGSSVFDRPQLPAKEGQLSLPGGTIREPEEPSPSIPAPAPRKDPPLPGPSVPVREPGPPPS